MQPGGRTPNPISALAERLAIVLAVAGRKLMDLHGRIETRRQRQADDERGDQIYPASVEDGQPVFDHTHYTDARIDLLQKMIEEEKLDALVIVGCSFGRELVALSKRMGNSGLAIYGAERSVRCIEACRKYDLPNTKLAFLDVEDDHSTAVMLEQLSGHERVGFYMCETAPYILPDKLQNFFSALGSKQNVAAVQVLEPMHIDWASRFQTGMIFSYRDGYWRHNFYRLFANAGFQVRTPDIISPSLRTDIHRNQPLWSIRGGR